MAAGLALVAALPVLVADHPRLRRWLFGLNCDRLPTQEFDSRARKRCQTPRQVLRRGMAPTVGIPRFLLAADESRCGVTATIRVRLVGAITVARQAACESAIEAAWSRSCQSPLAIQ